MTEDREPRTLDELVEQTLRARLATAERDLADLTVAYTDALGERDEARAALTKLAESQPRALAYIRANGFVWNDKDSIGTEPGNWQHLAFSLYSDLCEVDSIVAGALAATPEGKAER